MVHMIITEDHGIRTYFQNFGIPICPCISWTPRKEEGKKFTTKKAAAKALKIIRANNPNRGATLFYTNGQG